MEPAPPSGDMAIEHFIGAVLIVVLLALPVFLMALPAIIRSLRIAHFNRRKK